MLIYQQMKHKECSFQIYNQATCALQTIDTSVPQGH